MIKTSPPQFDLLTTPVFRADLGGHKQTLTLPGLMAALAADSVDSITGLIPHQKHSWHALLCQVAAIAMVKNHLPETPTDPEQWLSLLEDLAPEHPTAWRLVVPDVTKPAFLQPPATSPDCEKDYVRTAETPDQLDLTVGSKAHDVKPKTMSHPGADQWVYALAMRQTCGGYDGARLYGISRMNGGLSNRHCFSIAPSLRPGARFRRDATLIAGNQQGADTSRSLIWLLPWDGEKDQTLDPDELGPMPLYVEISRRIRMTISDSGAIAAKYATSVSPRINNKELLGMTQDPWMLTEENKVVTVPAEGFSCGRITVYLDPVRRTLPLLARRNPGAAPPEMVLIAETLVRGQGKTEGYHETAVHLPAKIAQMLGGPGQKTLHAAAHRRIGTIGEVHKILRHAAHTYADDNNNGDSGKSIANQCGNELQAWAEKDFYPSLWQELEAPEPDTEHARWTHGAVIPLAREILEKTTGQRAFRSTRKYYSAAIALTTFEQRIRNSKNLPAATAAETDETGGEEQ